MSELAAKKHEGNFRWSLMNAACAVALLAASSEIDGAKADDTDRPTVWIELGGQLERVGGTSDRFEAPFMTITPTPEPYKFAPPVNALRPPRYAVGGEGKISFEPSGSDWVFSAAVRYGRANGNKTSKHQTNHLQFVCASYGCVSVPVYPTGQSFVKSFAKYHESYSVLDFVAGKDVGLGMFGSNSPAVVSLGVRYAQFAIRSNVSVYAVPKVNLYNGFPPTLAVYYPTLYFPGHSSNGYVLHGESQRNFHGLGPSISISASTPLASGSNETALSLDWGGNASILFGRQRATVSHQTSANHYSAVAIFKRRAHSQLYPSRSFATARARSVTVPNIGGFAAISLTLANAKVSLGYRGDFFFGANDAGIDARKEDTLSFHGPYATISIGLGG